MQAGLVLAACLFLGVLINIGMTGIGYISRLVVPGLALGFLIWLVVMGVMTWKRR